jgi:hypothetical protein
LRALCALSRSKGISKSALPYRRTPPSWLKTSPTEVLEQVTKLAKKGLTPSQIGVILRDSHGIAQVSHVTGSKILRMLKKAGTLPTARMRHRERALRASVANRASHAHRGSARFLAAAVEGEAVTRAGSGDGAPARLDVRVLRHRVCRRALPSPFVTQASLPTFLRICTA